MGWSWRCDHFWNRIDAKNGFYPGEMTAFGLLIAPDCQMEIELAE